MKMRPLITIARLIRERDEARALAHDIYEAMLERTSPDCAIQDIDAWMADIRARLRACPRAGCTRPHAVNNQRSAGSVDSAAGADNEGSET